MSDRRAVTVWFTGLSGAGKTTLARRVEAELRDLGVDVELLDGDAMRETLCAGLGFSREDRDTNIRRIGLVADLLAKHGTVVLVAAISPYRAARDAVRAQTGDFVEIHVDAPMATLVDRDVKGLYRKALAGEIDHFTGVSDPYEAPLEPELRIVTDGAETVDESAARVVDLLRSRGSLPG